MPPRESRRKLQPGQPYTTIPYLSQEAHTDPPPLKLENFIRPKLGRFTQKLVLRELVGNGNKGVVFKSSLQDGTAVVVKVFFHSTRPTEEKEMAWWGFEQESVTGAILHALRARCEQLEREDQSIYLLGEPQSRDDALFNLQAFSDEHLITEASAAQSHALDLKPFRLKVTTPRCYGWTEVSGPAIRQALYHSGITNVESYGLISEPKLYPAIIYEFIPKGKGLKKEVIDTFMDFLRLTGFVPCPTFFAANWHGEGVLVDQGDIVSAIMGRPTWPSDRAYRTYDFKDYQFPTEKTGQEAVGAAEGDGKEEAPATRWLKGGDIRFC